MRFIAWLRLRIFCFMGEKQMEEEKLVEEKGFLAEKNSIGNKMLYCRECVGLSQEEMSRFVKIDKSLIDKYENDIIPPSLKHLLQFSHRFEIPMEKFVDDAYEFIDFASDYDIFHFIKFQFIYKIFGENKTLSPDLVN